jgi:gliding motility-associated-like protein
MIRYFNIITLVVLALYSTVSPFRSDATHLMGGEITYTYDGSLGGSSFYIVRLIVYRYCDNSGGTTAPLDPEMFLGIYTHSPGNPGGDLNWHSTESLTLLGSTFVTAAPGNGNCPFQPTACIERGEYEVVVLLEDIPVGYHLLVERCCRNGNIVNISNPGSAGMSYYAYIPPGIINSTPQITDISVPYLCTGDTVALINNAFDPDGDSLAYSFVIPYNGNSSPMDPMPDPFLIDPYYQPIQNISFAPGFSQTAVFGPGGYASIDPITGLTQYYIPNQGFYVAAIEIREYRNGVLIGAIRRDLQFIAITCTPNMIPAFSPGASGTTYTVAEGQPLCFNVTFSDPDGDSLYMIASGPLLNPAITNPAGAIANASGLGTVSSQFCWTPVCGMSRPSPYQFSVTVTDNGCPQKSTSIVFSVFVTAGAGALTPSVGITQNPSGALCMGTQVSYQANPVLGGSNPLYTWFHNGNVVNGVSGSVYTPTILNNGDAISVTMISSATCLLTDSAVSNPFVANILSIPAPQVSITSNPSGNLCPQQIAIFTANVSNAGSSPSYQWNINGNPSGTNQPAFSAANPSGIMTVFVTVTPSTGCPPQVSNTIVFNIRPTLNPQVVLTSSVVDSICPGEAVTFTATSTMTGNPPQYTWYHNGTNLGLSGNSISLSNIMNGDVINVSVTSSYPCLSPANVFADPLFYYWYPPLTADLTDGPIEICKGLPVSLTMTTQGGMSSSWSYQWSQGNSTSFTNSFIPLWSGYYYATVDDVCYSQVMDSLYIEVLPVPVSDFGWSPENPSVFVPVVQFTDHSISAISWEWNLGDSFITYEQHPLHEYLTSGSFPVKLVTTNDVGCTDTLVKILEVDPFITVYVPNSFTPNGDGRNDYFAPVGFGTGGFIFRVYNRWGQVIFESGSSTAGWNGKSKDGVEAPEGTYVYSVVAKDDRSKKRYTGTLTLIR